MTAPPDQDQPDGPPDPPPGNGAPQAGPQGYGPPRHGTPASEDEVSHTESIRYTSSLEIWDLLAQGAL